LPTDRELRYVEEKGAKCDLHSHRRNHTILSERRPGTKSPPLTRVS
jgi:hypothetical protein